MKKLESIANVAVLVAALLLSYVLVKQIIVQHSPASASSTHPHNAQGMTLIVPGVKWSDSDRTLVLAVSSHCPFCINSMDFYHHLVDAKRSAHSSSRLIAVLPEETESATVFLNKHQVHVDQIADSRQADIHIEGTPTLLLVDGQGKVTQEWVGKLAPATEKEVIHSLLD